MAVFIHSHNVEDNSVNDPKDHSMVSSRVSSSIQALRERSEERLRRLEAQKEPLNNSLARMRQRSRERESSLDRINSSRGGRAVSSERSFGIVGSTTTTTAGASGGLNSSVMVPQDDQLPPESARASTAAAGTAFSPTEGRKAHIVAKILRNRMLM